MSAIKNRVKAFATHLMDLAMESDDPQQALAYMEICVSNLAPAISAARAAEHS